jgi:NADPH:quinone reductase
MRCVVYSGVGGPEVVSVEERPDPTPGKFEVLIATAFSGVNPADVLQREGRHPVPPGAPRDVPGLEVAGTVVASGPAVTAFNVQDRAFGLVGGGGHSDHVVASERELLPVPDALDDRAAAAAPEAFLTAFDAICLQAGLASGDTLLVNGGNGGVGTAAIQIGAALGARVVASVRSEELRPRVAKLGATALAADEAFEHVSSLGGADVILELVGAPHMKQNLASLAKLGRLVIVGARPGDEATVDMRDLMTRRGRIMGTTLRTRPPEQKAALVQEFGRRVLPLLASGAAKPMVDSVFELDDVADALEHVRAPGKLGRVLLRTSAEI